MIINFSPLKKQAVLSVEAAVTVPVFMMACALLISIMNVCLIDEKTELILCGIAEEISVKAFDEDIPSGGVIEAMFCEKAGSSLVNSPYIKDTGFDFSMTDTSDREVIVLGVNYTVVFPFDMFGIFEIPFKKERTVHTWTGYVNGLSGEGISEYVYMTKNGTVYHRSRECSHIRLKIEAINRNDLKALRNTGGGRYKKCEYCNPKSADMRLYITEDGDRYHNTLSCPGLKRTILRVKLSDIDGVRPCSRCGY